MSNHKKIISEAIAKHFRHAKQGLRDVISPGGYLDELEDFSRDVYPYNRSGMSRREATDASTEDHAAMLRRIFGMPIVSMGPPGRPIAPDQVFTIKKIEELQGPKPPNFKYSSLGYLEVPRQRSVPFHSMRRAQYKINRSIDRLMAKHPGAEHPDAPVFNAQINSHQETLDRLRDAEMTLRKGALSDVGHPYGEEFHGNYEGHAPRVRAQLRTAIGQIDAAGKLLGRKAVLPPRKALPPGSETPEINTESTNIKSFMSFLSEASAKTYRQVSRILRDAEGLALGANAASHLASLPFDAGRADFMRNAMMGDIGVNQKLTAAAQKLRNLQLKQVMRADRIAKRKPLVPMPVRGGLRLNSSEMNDALAKHVALHSHKAGQLGLAVRQGRDLPVEARRSETYPNALYNLSLATKDASPKMYDFPEKYHITRAEFTNPDYMNRYLLGDKTVLRDLAFKHYPAMSQIFDRVQRKPSNYPNIDTILSNASQMRLPKSQRTIQSLADWEDLQDMGKI